MISPEKIIVYNSLFFRKDILLEVNFRKNICIVTYDFIKTEIDNLEN